MVDRMRRLSPGDQSRRNSTWFLRQEIRGPRVEDLDGKWEELKQWFDKEATTNALFGALGYSDQYRRASENISLYKAQIKLGQSSPLFDQKAHELRKEGVSRYQKSIEQIEMLKKDIEWWKGNIYFIQNKEEFSRYTDHICYDRLMMIYKVWKSRIYAMNKFSVRKEFGQKTEKYNNLVNETRNVMTQRRGGVEVTQRLRKKLEELRQETAEQFGLLVVWSAPIQARLQLECALNRSEKLLDEVASPLLQNRERLDALRFQESVQEFLACFRKLYQGLDEAKAHLLGKIDHEGAKDLLRTTSGEIEQILIEKSRKLMERTCKADEQFKKMEAILDPIEVKAAEKTYQQAFAFALGPSRNQLDRLRKDCQGIEDFFTHLDTVEIGIKGAKALLNGEPFPDQAEAQAHVPTSLQDHLKQLKRNQRALASKYKTFVVLKEIGYLDALCHLQERTKETQASYEQVRQMQASLNLEADQAGEFAAFLDTKQKELEETKKHFRDNPVFESEGSKAHREAFGGIATYILEDQIRRLKEINTALQQQGQERLRESIEAFPDKIKEKIEQFNQECLALPGKSTDGQEFADEVKQIVETVRSRFVPSQLARRDATNTTGLDSGRGLQKLLEYHKRLSGEFTDHLPACLKKMKRYVTALSNLQEVATLCKDVSAWQERLDLDSQREGNSAVDDLHTCLKDLQGHLKTSEVSHKRAKKGIFNILKNSKEDNENAVRILENKYEEIKKYYSKLEELLCDSEIKQIVSERMRELKENIESQYKQFKDIISPDQSDHSQRTTPFTAFLDNTMNDLKNYVEGLHLSFEDNLEIRDIGSNFDKLKENNDKLKKVLSVLQWRKDYPTVQKLKESYGYHEAHPDNAFQREFHACCQEFHSLLYPENLANPGGPLVTVPFLDLLGYHNELVMFEVLNRLEKAAAQADLSGQDLLSLPLGNRTVGDFVSGSGTLRSFSGGWLKTKYLCNVPLRDWQRFAKILGERIKRKSEETACENMYDEFKKSKLLENTHNEFKKFENTLRYVRGSQIPIEQNNRVTGYEQRRIYRIITSGDFGYYEGNISTGINEKNTNIVEMSFSDTYRYGGLPFSDILKKQMELFNVIRNSEGRDELGKKAIKVDQSTLIRIRWMEESFDTDKPPSRLSYRSITNPETLFTWGLWTQGEQCLKALREKRPLQVGYFARTDFEFTKEDDGFLSMLGTPNCRSAVYLLYSGR